MEAKKLVNRTYLTPEQREQNLARAKHNWYLNNKDLYKPGGRYYGLLTRVITCSCNRVVIAGNLRRHQKSKIHERCLQATL